MSLVSHFSHLSCLLSLMSLMSLVSHVSHVSHVSCVMSLVSSLMSLLSCLASHVSLLSSLSSLSSLLSHLSHLSCLMSLACLLCRHTSTCRQHKKGQMHQKTWSLCHHTCRNSWCNECGACTCDHGDFFDKQTISLNSLPDTPRPMHTHTHTQIHLANIGGTCSLNVTVCCLSSAPSTNCMLPIFCPLHELCVAYLLLPPQTVCCLSSAPSLLSGVRECL